MSAFSENGMGMCLGEDFASPPQKSYTFIDKLKYWLVEGSLAAVIVGLGVLGISKLLAIMWK